eukprot:m.125385 g.125385  ORF g.125385 m.125385 type:complete len:92 (+) comp15616_c0_seq1:475-750(+)
MVATLSPFLLYSFCFLSLSLLFRLPLSSLAIAGAGLSLIGGFWAYRTGRQQLSQYLQRARVGFQGLAVAALVIGTWSVNKEGKKDAPAASN